MPLLPDGKTKIKGEEHLQFKCNRCGSCCALWVPVTDDDVRRLIEQTALPPGKIVQFVASSRIQAVRGTITWIKFGPRKSDKKAMCLREARGRCYFLRARKCEVYWSRPVVCREHPFVLTLDKPGRKIKTIRMNTASTCSHTRDGKVSRRDLKKIYRWNLSQDESYLAKVKRWNRRKNPGSERDFLLFLGLRDSF